MDTDSFESFIDAINLGFEPRAVDGYRARYGVFYLRKGDELKAATGPPPLPEEFLRGLFKAPVIATVVAVKKEGDVFVATIDRGSADGLKLNTTLVTTTPTSDYRPFIINSLAEHSAEVIVYGPVEVGEKFSTRVADTVLRDAE